MNEYELESARLAIEELKISHKIMINKVEKTAEYIKKNAGNISKNEMDRLFDDLIESI